MSIRFLGRRKTQAELRRSPRWAQGRTPARMAHPSAKRDKERTPVYIKCPRAEQNRTEIQTTWQSLSAGEYTVCHCRRWKMCRIADGWIGVRLTEKSVNSVSSAIARVWGCWRFEKPLAIQPQFLLSNLNKHSAFAKSEYHSHSTTPSKALSVVNRISLLFSGFLEFVTRASIILVMLK